MAIETKPIRCVDPVMKFCEECAYGWVDYGDYDPLFSYGNSYECGCTLGYDQGRPEDEPTEEELKEFEEWCRH